MMNNIFYFSIIFLDEFMKYRIYLKMQALSSWPESGPTAENSIISMMEETRYKRIDDMNELIENAKFQLKIPR